MMKGLIYILCMVLLFIIWPAKTFAQNFPELQFEHLTTKDGLSSNSITGIAEDKQGFMWIGTINGLNRYDGYRFKQYYHSNTDSNSLVNNGVQSIVCDTKGRLWISTEDGVSCFIPAENRFINFSTILKAPHQLKINSSVHFYEDEKGVIWLCGQLDVIYKVLTDFTLQQVKINTPAFPFYNLSLVGYNGLFRDRNGSEWAFQANRLYHINKLTKQPEKTFDFSRFFKAHILKIIQDSIGNYFITTWDRGLWRFFPDKNTAALVTALPKRIFTDVVEWNYKKEKWIACLEINFGLYLLHPKTFTARKYGFIAGDHSSVQGSNFTYCFIDKKGNLWLGSNKGLNKIVNEQDIFDVIPITEPGTANYDIRAAGRVYSFFETGSSIWLSKRIVSTFEYDTAFQLKNYYRSLYPLSITRYSNNATAYYFYKKQNELYASTDSGLIVYDLLHKKSAVYFPDENPLLTNFRTIISLDDNHIMLRSFGNGIFIFNTVTKKFTKRFSNTNNCNQCLPFKINYLFKTRQNEIFASTMSEGKNLFRYDKALDSFILIKAVNDEKYSMQAGDLFGMDEDTNGNLWITGSGGVFIYTPTTNTILEQKNDNEQTGGLSRICFDNYGNSWASGSSGIWCYLVTKKKWISFTGQDGLPGSDFDGGVIIRKKNGDIVAGLEGAIAIFHPEKLTAQFNNYAAILTESSVNNKTVSFALSENISKKLTIAPGQNSFSVDFAVLNYLNPVSTRYYYKLAPLMNNFQLNNNGHINFNGLTPGHYTLYVKGGDKAGNIFEKEDILDITIEPKWYQTNWFKGLCLFGALALVIGIYKWRVNTIRNQAGFKQKMAETEMQALRGQMNPHFIFNSLNSIENFIMQNEKRLASDYLNKFSRLIRSILDSSRNEVVPLAKDMEALQLYVELEQLRFNNKFSYHTHVDPVLLQGDFRVPSLLIQPYVENAIVHGISHSHKEELQLTVTAVLESDTIRYTVQDNGVGRKQSDKYNLQNKPKHKSIGLKITEDRINIFNRQAIGTNIVKFTDLYDASNNPAGTKVEITINTLVNE
jgi:ligand-binding sensor domain-containing protein